MRQVRWAALAGAVVLVVAAGWLALVPRPSPPQDGPGATLGPAGFPAAVGGMPVVSVAQAAALLDAGDLDGRAIAVAGHYFSVAMSCPAPQGYVGPLEGWCRMVAFADDAAGATMCTYGENTTDCHAPPSGVRLAPWFMPETAGMVPQLGRAPVPLVLVGHAGDARQLQCSAGTQAECAGAFVVDRVAWSNGEALPLTAPEAWDRMGWQQLLPRMTVDEVAAALGGGDEVLSAAAFQAGDVSRIDPRWNLAGDDLVWVVRSVPASGPSDDPTRQVTVALVDDATGALIGTHDLALDPVSRPARLWAIATRTGDECCAGDVYPFYRVERVGGGAVHDGRIEGTAYGAEDWTTYGPGAPLVLEPGTYEVSAWVATVDRTVTGPPADACSTRITLAEADDLMLDAVFPAPGQACTFGEPSPPSLTYD